MPLFRSLAAAAVSTIAAELRGNPLDNPAVPLSAFPQWMSDLFTGGPNASGVAVNEQTAMQQSTVFTCVSILARDISTLPLIVYEHDGEKRKAAVDSDLYDLITVRPNPEMTAPAFYAAWYGSAILTGNGYAEIQRVEGKPVALWPRNPRMVKPRRDAGSDLVYDVTVDGKQHTVRPADMLHLRGFSLDGWTGMSPIMAAKVTIGTAIATENFGAGFFGRGSRPSGLLTGPELKPGHAPQTDTARESWERANSGGSQGRTAVLPFGWTWTAIGITPEEAQFLGTQQHTRTMIAALFGLPAHKVGDTSPLGKSSYESSQLDYASNTLRPWLVNGESEIQAKLLPRVGRKAFRYTAEHDISELIRGDFMTQMQGMAIARQWGGATGDEFRRVLRLNPKGGVEGETLLVPLNMVAADSVPTGPQPEQGAGSAGDGDNPDFPDDAGANTPKAKGNGGRNQLRSRQEGVLVERMAVAYAPLVADACQRLARRDKRDSEAVAQIFGPACDVIAAEARRQAGELFDLAGDPDLGQERALRDYRKSIEKRCGEWPAVGLGAESLQSEVARAVRAIVVPIFREAGGYVAINPPALHQA